MIPAPSAKLSDRLRWAESFGKAFLSNPASLVRRKAGESEAISATLQSILRDTSAVELLSETGLPNEPGFFSEAADRFLKRFLPSPPRDRELSEVFCRVFSRSRHAEIIENLTDADLSTIARWIGSGGGDFSTILRPSLIQAISLLVAQLVATGTHTEIRARLTPSAGGIRDSAFYVLGLTTEEFLTQNFDQTRLSACLSAIQRCRETVRSVFSHLEESGVSIALVFRLEKLTALLDRLESLLRFIAPEASQPPSNRRRMVANFVSRLIRESVSDRGVAPLVQSTIHLLSRKIAERAGETGEALITRTTGEYRWMFFLAAGGGAVTLATTLAKYEIALLGFPFFFEGFFNFLNYSSSFLLMQFLGLKLATKQPSMTAAALAGKITSEDTGEAFAETVARITRSQFAAAMGNILAIIPAAFAFDQAYLSMTSRHFLDFKTAQYTLQSLHPWQGATLFYAGVTGIALWLSSVASGWAENAWVFRRMPEAIGHHPRLNRLFGKKFSAFLSRSFTHGVAGVAACLSLGFFLAFIPIIGKFFGAPLDIRHVTLAAGSLSLALATLMTSAADLRIEKWGPPVLGIAGIGLLNFGVSFALALQVAIRARRVRTRHSRVLLGQIFTLLKRSPSRFFIPVLFAVSLVSAIGGNIQSVSAAEPEVVASQSPTTTYFTLREAPARPRGYFFPPLFSFLLPGMDQWWEYQTAPALAYTGTAVGGIYLAQFSARSGNSDLFSKDDRKRLTVLGALLYQGAGGFSAYHSFRSAVDSRRQAERDEFRFLGDGEKPLEILAAPLRFDYLLRPTTIVPLAVGLGLNIFIVT
ncbi:MAG: hypothetical protein AAB425_14895, partial [Bdellovibrionota bacterium]